MNPFDVLKAINETKEQIITKENEKDYNAYMTNRGLSYFADTIFYANEMNLHYDLDKLLQFDYLNKSVRKKKRFSKWFKAEQTEEIKAIQAYYKYSYIKAKTVADILTKQQKEKIIKLVAEVLDKEK